MYKRIFIETLRNLVYPTAVFVVFLFFSAFFLWVMRGWDTVGFLEYLIIYIIFLPSLLNILYYADVYKGRLSSMKQKYGAESLSGYKVLRYPTIIYFLFLNIFFIITFISIEALIMVNHQGAPFWLYLVYSFLVTSTLILVFLFVQSIMKIDKILKVAEMESKDNLPVNDYFREKKILDISSSISIFLMNLVVFSTILFVASSRWNLIGYNSLITFVLYFIFFFTFSFLVKYSLNYSSKYISYSYFSLSILSLSLVFIHMPYTLIEFGIKIEDSVTMNESKVLVSRVFSFLENILTTTNSTTTNSRGILVIFISAFIFFITYLFIKARNDDAFENVPSTLSRLFTTILLLGVLFFGLYFSAKSYTNSGATDYNNNTIVENKVWENGGQIKSTTQDIIGHWSAIDSGEEYIFSSSGHYNNAIGPLTETKDYLTWYIDSSGKVIMKYDDEFWKEVVVGICDYHGVEGVTCRTFNGEAFIKREE